MYKIGVWLHGQARISVSSCVCCWKTVKNNVSSVHLQHVNKIPKPNLHGKQNFEDPTIKKGHF